jgi:hypothetical protein
VKLASDFSRLKTTLLHAGAVLDYELTSVSTRAGGAVSDGGTPEDGLDGTGTDASFSNQTQSFLLDGSGNLYLADGIDGQRIRKVTPAGVVTTLVDASDSGGIQSHVLDSSGNLYVVAEQKIRKVTPEGVVTTLAGGGESGSNADGPGTSASFNQITDLVADGSGTL